MRMPTFNQFQRHIESLALQFQQMNKLIEQANSGQKIQVSSEDPILASQIKSTQRMIENLDSYTNNEILAKHRSELFADTIKDSADKVAQIKTLILKAQDGTLSDKDRMSIAEQLKGSLTSLVAQANTHDADGNYIFSGFNSNTMPFELVNGSYVYQGGLSQSFIDIGPNVSTLFYESGYSVFGNIYDGNGTYTINANSSNTGSMVTTPGSVNPGYVADTYTMTFVTNSSGQLAYQIVGANSGQVIPPSPGTLPDDAPAYLNDSSITFNGINFHTSGSPAVGDSLTIQPSTAQNVFNATQNLIDALESPVTNRAQFTQTLSQLSATFNGIADHFSSNLTRFGTQAAAVSTQIKNNADTSVRHLKTLQGLSEVNPEEVYSAIASKSIALQASQAGYMKLQETLLALLRV